VTEEGVERIEVVPKNALDVVHRVEDAGVLLDEAALDQP